MENKEVVLNCNVIAVRNTTARPTACTAGCQLVLHNGSFLGATASDSWRPVTAPFLAQNGLAATAPRCLPTEPILVQGRPRFVVAWEDQREHDCGWGIFCALFG